VRGEALGSRGLAKPPTPAARIEQDPPTAPAGESDEVLMESFCRGDPRAFELLFERYARPIHRYLSRVVRQAELADDLTQTTFLSLVRARGRFQSGAKLKPWLYAIATNAARDHLRKRQEELTSDGNLPHRAAAEAAPTRDAGLERAVQAALGELPETQRLAIVLHKFEGLSFAEVADALGTTEGAVKVRAHRGYERLRERLRGVWEDV
jgi:RNA polymerase sigma factor (sigma-70 family)